MGRRKGPALTRADVIAAAIRCVEAEGPDALGVSRVARELGIQPPSIYNHVGKGDALAWAVVIEANRILLASLESAVEGLSEPEAQLRALAHGTRSWAIEHKGLYELMGRVQPDNDDPDFWPTMRRTIGLFARPLAALGVAESDAIHAIRGFRSAMHGFLLLEASGQFQLADRPEDSYRWLVEALIRGLDA